MVEVQSLKSKVQSSKSEVRGAKLRLGAWVLDRKGSTLTQFVLVLPLFLVLLYGSFAVWKVASAKQSLASGTYQAARYLSVEGRYLNYPWDWKYAASIIIARELENNSLLRPPPDLDVTVEPASRPQCPPEDAIRNPWPYLDRALFTITAQIILPWPARIPYLDPETITLVERRTSYLECEPILPGPTVEPEPTPTPTPVP